MHVDGECGGGSLGNYRGRDCDPQNRGQEWPLPQTCSFLCWVMCRAKQGRGPVAPCWPSGFHPICCPGEDASCVCRSSDLLQTPALGGTETVWLGTPLGRDRARSRVQGHWLSGCSSACCYHNKLTESLCFVGGNKVMISLQHPKSHQQCHIQVPHCPGILPQDPRN